MASAVRELSVSKNPAWIAAAFFDKTIQIWDLASQGKINEFSTVFCSGAKNLALAPFARVLVAGLSVNPGKLAAYEAPSGGLLWERRLIYPSSLRFHRSGESVLCSSNNASTLRLDVHTGTDVEVLKGISQFIEGPDGGGLKVPAKGAPFRLASKDHEFEVARAGLALLDARFSADAVCLTEARGSVRCIDRDDGRQRWRFDPDADSQVLLLHYSQGMDAFFGVLQNLAKREARHLVRFDGLSGACEWVCSLDSWGEAFLESDQIITSTGEVKDLSSGAVVARLAFPIKEYPDE